MKKIGILTLFVFILSIISVSMVMAQAKPAAKEPIKFGAIYDFAGGCHMYSESAITGIKLAVAEINAKAVFWVDHWSISFETPRERPTWVKERQRI